LLQAETLRQSILKKAFEGRLLDFYESKGVAYNILTNKKLPLFTNNSFKNGTFKN
jgi:hypothetical protein